MKDKCVHDVKNINEKNTNKLHSCEMNTNEHVQNVTSLNDKITTKQIKKNSIQKEYWYYKNHYRIN